MPSIPHDLIPVREAARLVGRGYSTVRGWIAAGDLEAYTGVGTHPSNAPVMVSRSEILTLCATSKSTAPPRAGSATASPPASVDAVLRAELDGARAVVEAQRATVAALEARARDLSAALDAERATVAGMRAELAALRDAAGLPWWRRLLGSPSVPAELTGNGEA